MTIVVAEADLNKGGAEGGFTQPGGTVQIEGGHSGVMLNKAKSLKGEASFLLQSVDHYHSLAIPVTPYGGHK